MQNKNIIHIKIDVAENSLLEKNIHAYLKNLSLLRKERKEKYQREVEKQIKKIERSGL